jgi:single-strand DNA-binding protein
MNQVTLCGNVGSDIEVRTTGSGKKVANFSLATSEKYKDKTTGETKSVTEWHNILMWEPLSAIAEKYVHKGSKLLLTGKIKTRSYDSNGTKKYITEITADHLELLGQKPEPSTILVMENSGVPSKDNSTDDLPF